MSGWRPIATAPKDRWIYIWQADTAKVWAEEFSELDEPYTPRVAKWSGAIWFVDNDGSRVKGATHWRPLFDPPREQP